MINTRFGRATSKLSCHPKFRILGNMMCHPLEGFRENNDLTYCNVKCNLYKLSPALFTFMDDVRIEEICSQGSSPWSRCFYNVLQSLPMLVNNIPQGSIVLASYI